MNVAYHLTKLGQPTTFISRMGNDALGRKLKTILENKKVNLDNMQTDGIYPTGIVLAQLDAAGDMQYEIKESAAWDFIEWKPQYETLVKNANYFVYGSLITRSKVSRNTLLQLLDIPVTRVFDVNLRPPFIDQMTVEYQFSKTDILKMNEGELDTITNWYVQFKAIEDKIRFLRNRFDISEIIVTRGSRGAVVYTNDLFYYHNGYPVQVADTIGSGDSFVAGYLSGIINHKPPDEVLNFACALGGFVATQTGGCPAYSENDIIDFIQSQASIIS